jgi:hypothetical protein
MKREFVKSSNIKSIGYDVNLKILEVEFYQSGIYQYLDVPENLYKELMSALSKGSFFYSRIKNYFLCKKII